MHSAIRSNSCFNQKVRRLQRHKSAPLIGRRALVVRSMFTGIVQGTAEVAQLDTKENFRSFRIQFPAGRTDNIQIGASVAINGTCLTVTAIDGDVLSFDVMAETLRATSLGNLQVGCCCQQC
jgi:riboflavin synthase